MNTIWMRCVVFVYPLVGVGWDIGMRMHNLILYYMTWHGKWRGIPIHTLTLHDNTYCHLHLFLFFISNHYIKLYFMNTACIIRTHHNNYYILFFIMVSFSCKKVSYCPSPCYIGYTCCKTTTLINLSLSLSLSTYL